LRGPKCAQGENVQKDLGGNKKKPYFAEVARPTTREKPVGLENSTGAGEGNPKGGPALLGSLGLKKPVQQVPRKAWNRVTPKKGWGGGESKAEGDYVPNIPVA